MIKKIIGVVAVIAVLVLIIMTALGAGSYKSMLPDASQLGTAHIESVATQAESADAEPTATPEQVTE